MIYLTAIVAVFLFVYLVVALALRKRYGAP
jgi:hypothetical protein